MALKVWFGARQLPAHSGVGSLFDRQRKHASLKVGGPNYPGLIDSIMINLRILFRILEMELPDVLLAKISARCRTSMVLLSVTIAFRLYGDVQLEQV
jgi:hypothetical protein